MPIERQPTDRRQSKRRATWLVEDWRRCYKWLSVQIPVIMASAAVLYQALPEVQAYIPHAWLPWVGAAGAIGLIFGRLKAQK